MVEVWVSIAKPTSKKSTASSYTIEHRESPCWTLCRFRATVFVMEAEKAWRYISSELLRQYHRTFDRMKRGWRCLRTKC